MLSRSVGRLVPRLGSALRQAPGSAGLNTALRAAVTGYSRSMAQVAEPLVRTTGSLSNDYEFEHDDKIADGDPSKRAYTYFVLGGARFVFASFGRLAVLKLVHSMNASADVLALASTEVDISGIAEGTMLTLKWRGKPVFIKHRTASEIKAAEDQNPAELRHPQSDSERVQKPSHLIVLGVCTHLGCVPLGNQGDFAGGFFCPCHGSHYDTSGRIRKGPAPLNLELPPYKFIEEQKVFIG